MAKLGLESESGCVTSSQEVKSPPREEANALLGKQMFTEGAGLPNALSLIFTSLVLRVEDLQRGPEATCGAISSS